MRLEGIQINPWIALIHSIFKIRKREIGCDGGGGGGGGEAAVFRVKDVGSGMRDGG